MDIEKTETVAETTDGEVATAIDAETTMKRRLVVDQVVTGPALAKCLKNARVHPAFEI